MASGSGPSSSSSSSSSSSTTMARGVQEASPTAAATSSRPKPHSQAGAKAALEQQAGPGCVGARYYVDELGFYRYLDPEQRHYVCSNTGGAKYESAAEGQQQAPGGALSATAEGGYEICLDSIRRELRISHFDRTLRHKQWKSDWDDFMRRSLGAGVELVYSKRLKARIRQGIPQDYRYKVWRALVLMHTRRIRDQFGHNVYERILAEFVDHYDQAAAAAAAASPGSGLDRSKRPADGRRAPPSPMPGPEHGCLAAEVLESDTDVIICGGRLRFDPNQADKCFKQIELDLLRTLPNNRCFEQPHSLGTGRVRRVLRAYACFNPRVGYCQGMNRLAAMALLIFHNELEAFWCLVAIVQCLMPPDYYLKPWLAQVDCEVLTEMLADCVPELHQHLLSKDIQLALFSWFFTIFVDGFRPELMLRIWDCFLCEGNKVLFRFALAILWLSQHELLKLSEASLMSQYLARLASTCRLDIEQLFDTAFQLMGSLPARGLEKLRAKHRRRMEKMMGFHEGAAIGKTVSDYLRIYFLFG